MPSFTMMNLFQQFLRSGSSKKFVGNLIEMPNGQVPDEVYRGNCNIGLHYVTSSQYEASIQKFRSMGIVFTTLVNEPLYAVLNTKSPLSKLDKIYLEQLHGMNFLQNISKFLEKETVENNPLTNRFLPRTLGVLVGLNNHRL